MKSSLVHNRLLHLEALEARTLLAAGNDLDVETKAVVSFDGLSIYTTSMEGDFRFELIHPESDNIHFKLMLVGSSKTSITIELGGLPSFITTINLSSFENVTIRGTNTLNGLGLENVKKLDAPDLSLLLGLNADNTGEVTLHSSGKIMLLTGGKTMNVNVPNLDGTQIYSDLKFLRLNTESPVLGIWNTGTIELAHPAEVRSLGSSGVIGLKGDFPDPGNEKPGSPTNENVVIVASPVGEELGAFLSRLRELLQQTRGDTQQLVFDFVSKEKPAAATETIRVSGHLAETDRGSLAENETRPISAPDSMVKSGLEIHGAPLPTLGEVELGSRRENAIDSVKNNEAPIFEEWLPWVPEKELPQIAAVAALRADDVQSTSNSTEQIGGVTIVGLDEERPTAGDYIRQKITNEFLPGQRNAVLLVDPKPSRSRIGASEDPLSDFL